MRGPEDGPRRILVSECAQMPGMEAGRILKDLPHRPGAPEIGQADLEARECGQMMSIACTAAGLQQTTSRTRSPPAVAHRTGSQSRDPPDAGMDLAAELWTITSADPVYRAAWTRRSARHPRLGRISRASVHRILNAPNQSIVAEAEAAWPAGATITRSGATAGFCGSSRSTRRRRSTLEKRLIPRGVLRGAGTVYMGVGFHWIMGTLFDGLPGQVQIFDLQTIRLFRGDFPIGHC